MGRDSDRFGSFSGLILWPAAIYVRRGTQTVRATHDEVQDLLAANIRSYSSVQEFDLEQRIDMLRTLYRQLAKEPIPYGGAFEEIVSKWQRTLAASGIEPAAGAFPDESFRDFLIRMIHQMKTAIENSITVG